MTLTACRHLITAVATIGLAAPLHAHNSDRMIAGTEPVWLKGTIVEYRPINPHAMITLAVTGEDGTVEDWTIEGPRLGRFTELRLEANGYQEPPNGPDANRSPNR
jgi:hypothetical protein